jgi:hypothetical protein
MATWVVLATHETRGAITSADKTVPSATAALALREKLDRDKAKVMTGAYFIVGMTFNKIKYEVILSVFG